MSDLAATNCGIGCGEKGFSGAWILIILLLCCGGGHDGFLGGGFGRDCGGGHDGCGAVVWIILILCLCGGDF